MRMQVNCITVVLEIRWFVFDFVGNINLEKKKINKSLAITCICIWWPFTI